MYDVSEDIPWFYQLLGAIAWGYYCNNTITTVYHKWKNNEVENGEDSKRKCTCVGADISIHKFWSWYFLFTFAMNYVIMPTPHSGLPILHFFVDPWLNREGSGKLVVRLGQVLVCKVWRSRFHTNASWQENNIGRGRNTSNTTHQSSNLPSRMLSNENGKNLKPVPM